MCGLVGIMSSNMLNKHKDALSTMLYLDTFRGKDSTGVAAIRHDSMTDVLKATIPGYEFVEGPRLHNHLRLNDFLWIGHNRFGTIGKNCKSNAHPFIAEDDEGFCSLVGAHNGTLKNKHVLTDHTKYGTDSEALYNEISNIGVEDALQKVEGAWALTYYDHGEREFRIIRNKERPLFYAWSEDKHTLLWASEMWMIRVACSRHDIKLFEDKVYTVAEDTLYRFSKPTKMNEELTCERKGGVVGKETPAFFQQESGTGGRTHETPAQKTLPGLPAVVQPPRPNPGDRTGQRLSVVGGNATETSTSQSGTKTSTVGGRPLLTSVNSSRNALVTQGSDGAANKHYKGYNCAILTLSQLQDDLSNGCSFCEIEMIETNDKFAWLAPGKPVCVKCLTGEHDDFDDAILASASIH